MLFNIFSVALRPKLRYGPCYSHLFNPALRNFILLAFFFFQDLFLCVQTSAKVDVYNRCVYKYLSTEGDQVLPPRNASLWHKDYFELKAIKTQQIQGKVLYLPFNCHTLYWKRGLPERELFTRDTFYLGTFLCNRSAFVF